MSENKAAKKHLPTGEEFPKGYETLGKDLAEDGFRVDFVMYRHLARSERAEIEALRSKAFESVQEYIGLSNEPLDIDQEVGIISQIDDTNKMFALVFFDKKLVGYSLVSLGWPEPCKWLIQHMIIDPDMRRRGIGTTIVKSIEGYAQESEVAADAIFAVPIQESGKSFWQEMGYTVEAARIPIAVDEVTHKVNHEVIVYHKAL